VGDRGHSQTDQGGSDTGQGHGQGGADAWWCGGQPCRGGMTIRVAEKVGGWWAVGSCNARGEERGTQDPCGWLIPCRILGKHHSPRMGFF
jgi:hypothetical protein